MRPLVARLLAVLYSSQVVRIKWKNFLSTKFYVSNGAKQGGVLSPILFGIYITMSGSGSKRADMVAILIHF